ncbi:MAG: hypothetical protein PVJ63_06435 [Thioalkalispiraceae bacterium]|jgi:hypothetical protein
MRTFTLNPLQINLSTALQTAVKLILSLLVLLYAVFHFSTFHWVLFGLFALCVMAIRERLSRIDAVLQKNDMIRPNVMNADGGAFRQLEQPRQPRRARPIVQDGGIFKRRHQK